MHNGIDAVEVDQQVGAFRMEIFFKLSRYIIPFPVAKTETLKAF